jgi:hypothetical protein
MSVILPPAIFLEIVHEKCGVCGIHFGLEKPFKAKRLVDHQIFHCPNGHEIHYTGESEADRLRTQLRLTENALTYARQDVDRLRSSVKVRDRQIAARKGIITRFKRRITAGRCVCCSRQFKDLETHMEKRHPNFDPERAVDFLATKPNA